MPNQDRDIVYAKRIFTYYFRILAQETGMHWDQDNVTEIDEAVEALGRYCTKNVRGPFITRVPDQH